MKKWGTIFIRGLLTALLLWAVYRETGTFTTVAIGLIAVSSELQTILNKKVLEICEMLSVR